MRLHRFYIEQPLGEELVVEQSELVHQWISVFRYQCEDEVVLFSSANVGVDYIYRIASANKKVVTLSFVSKEKNILPKKEITLCMAIVKKDTFENVVRYATELGVSKIIPILAGRSEKKNLNLERLNSIAKEASEQSGRGTVPFIGDILSFNDALVQTEGDTNILTSLYGENSLELANNGLLKNNLNIWIGPEGGWTPDEEKLAKENNFVLMKLTETVLKADTAAVCALSALVID
ncbi:MAG: RsmE family RNA methyltransferase [Candidatus Nomurabacteria bacterium]|nr:RsmE family RNA methyltransferase [Candidatus Nomurabacteria bacterium]